MFFLDGGSGCGGILSDQTTNFIGSLVKVIKTLVPIILIIMGSLEFAKATVAQNDDGLKKAKTNFIQKLIAGVAVFFVITFVSWLLGFLGESFGNKALECVSQFLGGSYTPADISSGGNGSGSGDNSEEEYIRCTKQCKELNNATAKHECQKSCDAKYDKYTTTSTTTNERENCLKTHETKIKECIEQNKGNTSANFHTYDSFFQACMDTFDYTTGAYGIACQKLEQCFSDKYSSNDVCEELSQLDSTTYALCQPEFNSYKNYEKIYGPYTEENYDDKVNQCNNYAQRKVDEEKNGSQSNDNIEAYCKNLYCKN